MSTTDVGICNDALSYVSGKSISSLIEASAEARVCNLHYAKARDSLLTVYPWRFAMTFAALAQLEDNDWTDKWEYLYERPSDCLKLIKVTDVEDMDRRSMEHQLVGTKIYTSFSPAYAIYTKQITDSGLFPPLFSDALSYAVAARIAFTLTKDPRIRNDMIELGRMARVAAETADANEYGDTTDYDSETLGARE